MIKTSNSAGVATEANDKLVKLVSKWQGYKLRENRDKVEIKFKPSMLAAKLSLKPGPVPCALEWKRTWAVLSEELTTVTLRTPHT